MQGWVTVERAWVNTLTGTGTMRVDAESTRDRRKITADARMEAGRAQRVGGEGALPLETARSLDEEEESQESNTESLEAPFEPDDPLWLVKQMALELEAPEWMAMDEK
ncbi:hypothetical protein B0H14DRAFT_2555988 [Mycena olivaceomarginata]|nr:hypothetical protein B0H14DRAFT_2555988 [Mycena olivaceomarginata]